MNHVIPVGNGEPVHTVSEKCWCHPLITDIATHNAKDCREKLERQGLVNDSSKWAIVREETEGERVYLQEVKQENGEIWLRISAANAPRGVPPMTCFLPEQILRIKIQ